MMMNKILRTGLNIAVPAVHVAAIATAMTVPMPWYSKAIIITASATTVGPILAYMARRKWKAFLQWRLEKSFERHAKQIEFTVSVYRKKFIEYCHQYNVPYDSPSALRELRRLSQELEVELNKLSGLEGRFKIESSPEVDNVLKDNKGLH